MTDTPTKTRLANELRAVAVIASSEHAAVYRQLADRAETGEFDDYADVHVCGPTALYSLLMQHGLAKFANRVASGEFDASHEESKAWANSLEGRATMQEFTPELRAKLFGVFDS
jgi:hypothetical protein